MSNVTKVSKILDLDLTEVAPERKAEAKREIGDYVINEILRATERGSSPVQGHGKFRKLTDDYAKDEKGGRKTANMRLEGDMIDDLKSKNRNGHKIEVGIEGTNAPKADGHNQLSGEAKAWASRTKRTKYKRRFIPADNETFTDKINKGIKRIITEFKKEEELEEDEEAFEFESTASSTVITPVDGTPVINTSIDDLFSDDAIEALLQDAIRRRG